MAIDDDVRAMEMVPLFASLTHEQLRLIAFGTEHLTLSKGRELFRADERADCGFLVLSGEISLFEEQGTNRRIVGTAGPGSLIGELALIVDQKRPCGALAGEPTEVIRISRSLFRRVLDEYPDLAQRIHRQLQDRFSEFLGDITRLDKKFAD